LIVLGQETGDGAFIAGPKSVARDSSGRYYTVAQAQGEVPLVFRPDGTFLKRLGAVGEGPGEFRMPTVLRVTRGDSVRVLDMLTRRGTVFSPNLTYVRSFRLPEVTRIPCGVLWLPDGRLVLNVRLSDRERIGWPLHAFGPDGTYQESFGADAPLPVSPLDLTTDQRCLGPARDGGLWAAPFYGRYVLEHWDSRLNLTRRLERRASWFRASDRPEPLTPDHPPRSGISGLWEDATGLLWVVLNVGDARWARGLGAPRKVEGHTFYSVQEPDLVFDTVVEVLDPARGQVVSSRRFDEVLSVEEGLVRRSEEDLSSGALRVRLFTVVLVRP
jgi:hypothetical protein